MALPRQEPADAGGVDGERRAVDAAQVRLLDHLDLRLAADDDRDHADQRDEVRDRQRGPNPTNGTPTIVKRSTERIVDNGQTTNPQHNQVSKPLLAPASLPRWAVVTGVAVVLAVVRRRAHTAGVRRRKCSSGQSVGSFRLRDQA